MAQPIFGNYLGYYQKRPAIRDPRLSLLPQSFFNNKDVLDVGCNEGLVSIEIAQGWAAKRVTGVDIDPELVASAWKRRRSAWSVHGPPTDGSRLHGDTGVGTRSFHADHYPASFPYAYGPLPLELPQQASTSTGLSAEPWQNETPLNVCNGSDSYFPLSLVQSFGPLPLLPAEATPQTRFPHNVIFRATNWVEDGIPEDKGGYDVILAFSISKWIHLNGGDDGLIRFFRRVWDSLRPGGTFVLEPQGWDGYAKAKRIHPKLKESYSTLQLRPEGFDQLLLDIGFSPGERLGTTGEGGFRRPVSTYIRAIQ